VAGRCDRCGGELYQRPDDSAEAIQKRLEVYFAQTTPVIEYYQQRGKLIEVNGGQDIPQVNEEIITLLG
jgi:adenylate kinase